MLLIHQAVQQRQIYRQKNTPLVRAHTVVALNEAQTYIYLSTNIPYLKAVIIVMNICLNSVNDLLDIFCIYMICGDWYENI